MPFDKQKKADAEYRKHEAEIMRKAAEKQEKAKREIYESLVSDILSQIEIDTDAEKHWLSFSGIRIEELMNKYDIKLK